jgi:hypothetical protein
MHFEAGQPPSWRRPERSLLGDSRSPLHDFSIAPMILQKLGTVQVPWRGRALVAGVWPGFYE